MELVGNVAIGRGRHEEVEDFFQAQGHGLDGSDEVGAGLLPSSLFTVRLCEQRRGARSHHGLPGCGVLQEDHEFLEREVFREEPRGSSEQGLLEEVLPFEGGEHHHRHIWVLRGDCPGRCDAVEDGHVDIEQRDVNDVTTQLTEGVAAVSDGSDQSDLIVARECRAELNTQDGRVVREEDSQLLRFQQVSRVCRSGRNGGRRYHELACSGAACAAGWWPRLGNCNRCRHLRAGWGSLARSPSRQTHPSTELGAGHAPGHFYFFRTLP